MLALWWLHAGDVRAYSDTVSDWLLILNHSLRACSAACSRRRALALSVNMNVIGFVLRRLYVCLLVLALLPTGNSDPALSKPSSVRVPRPSDDLLDGDDQTEFSDEPAVGLRGDLPRLHRLAQDFGQTGSVNLAVHSRPGAPAKREFTPWGGKRTFRDHAAVWKRVKFQPWGGKRFTRKSVVPRYANNRMSAYVDDSDKREFHPWGGKR